MTDAIETRLIGDLTVALYHDDSTESPREWESESVFFGFHRSYASPDAAPDSDPETARRMANARENICLPVWLYAHSGTCYVASESNPFSCPWDSGLFGFIYISRADARKRLGVFRLTAERALKIVESLQHEVDSYSAWANGKTYRWSILDADGDFVDGCGGYIGDWEYALQEGIEAVPEARQTMHDFDEDAARVG